MRSRFRRKWYEGVNRFQYKFPLSDDVSYWIDSMKPFVLCNQPIRHSFPLPVCRWWETRVIVLIIKKFSNFRDNASEVSKMRTLGIIFSVFAML